MKRTPLKVKTTKKCKVCGNTFKPLKTTNRYCSMKCASQDYKQPENKSKAQPGLSGIKQQSDKTKKRLYEYHKRRKVFLSKPENGYCIVCAKIFNELALSTEIHHKKGRTGDLLLDEKYWLAVSRKGHNWIHDNPEKAYEKGFLISSTKK